MDISATGTGFSFFIDWHEFLKLEMFLSILYLHYHTKIGVIMIFLIEINTFIKKCCIKLIKSDCEDIQ